MLKYLEDPAHQPDPYGVEKLGKRLRSLYIMRPRSFTGFPQRSRPVVESSVRPTPVTPESTDGPELVSAPRSQQWHTPPVGSPVRLRLDLQRRAQDNLRRHVLRGAQRFLVLALADLASFAVMRALIRVVRDGDVVGAKVARVAESLTPAGILNGWQFACALFVSLVLLGCYGAGDRRRDPRRLFLVAALATALPLWMTIWIRGPSLVAMEFGLTTVLVWAALVAERSGVDWVVTRVRPPEQTAAKTLFVGTPAECAVVAGMAAFQKQGEFLAVGFVDTQVPAAPESLGQFVELARVLHDSQAETVVVCGQLSDGQLEDVASAALVAGCHLLLLPRCVDIPGIQPGIVWRQGQPFIELTAPTVRGWRLVVKRGLDILGSAIGLVALSPLFAFIAVWIKIDSPGPVFYASERWGREGRRIRIWKFRTMVDGAHQFLEMSPTLRAAYERDVKLVDDPRVTPVGWWLRRTSLDELPQLFNVLFGTMSLVGPRPKLLDEQTRYGALLWSVLDVPPGMTGLWQVSGRNSLSYERRIELDVEYVRRCSLWLDLRLLAQTIPVVVRGEGAH